MTPQIASQQHPPNHNEWWEAFKTAGIGLSLAIAVHTFIAEIRYIPSESMIPTLEVGDRVLVEKLSYDIHPPNRGDIVVFKASPALKSQSLDGDYIKRIIGLPGDIIQVKQGTVFVNGQHISEPYISSPPTYAYGPTQVPANQYFVLGDNRNHSYDSHLWGFVPQSELVGHAFLRWQPPVKVGFL